MKKIGNRGGIGVIQLLVTALILLGVAYFYLQSRDRQSDNFVKMAKDNGLVVPKPNSLHDGEAKALEKEVQNILDATAEQEEVRVKKIMNDSE